MWLSKKPLHYLRLLVYVWGLGGKLKKRKWQWGRAILKLHLTNTTASSYRANVVRIHSSLIHTHTYIHTHPQYKTKIVIIKFNKCIHRTCPSQPTLWQQPVHLCLRHLCWSNYYASWRTLTHWLTNTWSQKPLLECLLNGLNRKLHRPITISLLGYLSWRLQRLWRVWFLNKPHSYVQWSCDLVRWR